LTKEKKPNVAGEHPSEQASYWINKPDVVLIRFNSYDPDSPKQI